MLAAEKLIRRGVENGVFPYAEWAAFDKDGIFSRGATAGEGGRRFDLASLTKTFTATALLRLISEGKLRLEDDAASILEPPSPRLRDYLGQMSLYRLMTHTAGLPAWYPFYADGRPFLRLWRRCWMRRGRKKAWFTATSASCCLDLCSAV